MNFYIDIDLKEIGVDKELYYQSNYQYEFVDKIIGKCIDLKIPKPTRINFSGNGFHVYWKIKPVNETNEFGKFVYGANAKICFKIYNEIQKKLVEKFKEFGADDNAKDIARVLRIENIINSKNNKTCKTLFLND